MSNIRYKKS